MLEDDGEFTTRPTGNRKQSTKRLSKWKSNLMRLGITGFGIVILATLVSVAIFKSVHHGKQSMDSDTKDTDMQEILLKAIFSTNHVLDDELRSLKITNTDNITDQLNAILNAKMISIFNAFFRNHSISNGIICGNPLSGKVLQLNMVTLYRRHCKYQDDDMCKIQLQEQLKTIFSQMPLIPMTVQFDDGRSETIDTRICSIAEMTEAEEETIATDTKIKAKQAVMPSAVRRKLGRNMPRAIATPYSALQRARCALCINKIGLVEMPGELGSRINDDIRTIDISNDDRSRHYLTVSVYEHGNYRLTVQLDCGGYLSRDISDAPCSNSLSITAWIDFNDNGYDDGETQLLQRAWPTHEKATGIYNLDVRVPGVDGATTKLGPHRMTITVTPSDDYRAQCGDFSYKEVREYTCIVIQRDRPTLPPTPAPIICPAIAKIILVIMAGEKGTEIRDDLPSSAVANSHQNQHHMAVTLFEHTVYLLRIQLDCSSQSRTELTETGCNLAQDVNVWIDLNDDGNFDDTEVGAPYRWPVTSYMAEGIYDIQIYVPAISARNIRNGPHRMRIAVSPSDYYRRLHGDCDLSHTREYMVTIIPRMKYSAIDATPTSVVPHNVACSPDVGKLILVVMAGEHRTQIRDDDSTKSQLSGNPRIYQHLAIVLYEDTVYLLRIQLECTSTDGRQSVGNNCNLPHDVAAWIDLNDDGRFEDTEYAAPYRWPLTSYVPQGIYDLQIYVPAIDGRKTKSGPHRMRLDVMLNEQYRQKCGKNAYRETREYNVTIVQKNMHQTVDIGGPYLTLSDSVCSQTNGKIVLVIMAGEKGSHIRDDTPINTVIRDTQNQHHMAVTTYENTIYRLRIQLDCDQRSSRSSFKISCNLAQDVNVWIDFNNDGTFEESESRTPHRWPLRTTMTVGIYDLEIPIPSIDERSIKGGPHRMRIVVQSSDEYRRKCGRSDYSETREYTVNIIPKEISRDDRREIQWEAPREIPRENPWEAPRETSWEAPRETPWEAPRETSWEAPRENPWEAPRENTWVPPQEIPRENDYEAYRTTQCSPGNFVCSEGNSAIFSVSLSGEQHTQIWDDTKTCNSANNYNDRSTVAVTLFDNTAYNLRIELACVQQTSYGESFSQDPSVFSTDCNDARYLGVWVDFNNDGTFDESTEQLIPNQWHRDDPHVTETDLRINIPQIDNRYFLSGQHRMRIILTQDERNRRPCQSSGYGEVRDYTVQIMQKPAY
ncbi:unnamed protein product [Rotaria socialis]|nr:unnamed protein product [Rotaria socialis]